ncbi:MAG: hypothetical protein U0236_07735 [Nitrospira sp.]
MKTVRIGVAQDRHFAFIMQIIWNCSKQQEGNWLYFLHFMMLVNLGGLYLVEAIPNCMVQPWPPQAYEIGD